MTITTMIITTGMTTALTMIAVLLSLSELEQEEGSDLSAVQ